LAATDASVAKSANAAREGVVCSSDMWDAARTVAPGSNVEDLAGDPLLETVAAGMKEFGVRAGAVRVRSELDVNFGIGSSSALRLGIMLAMARGTGKAPLDIYGATHRDYGSLSCDLAREAFSLQKNHQKLGSGYDIATQLLGGIVLMEPAPTDEIERWPGRVTRMTDDGQVRLSDLVHVFVGGNGAPTGTTARQTMAWIESNGVLPQLMAASEDLIDEILAVQNAASQSIDSLIQAVARHRRILEMTPSFPQAIGVALQNVAGRDESWSYKTTGAGGEDALLVFGRLSEISDAKRALEDMGWFMLPTPFTRNGAEVKRTLARE
jgi:galactokinase/mevalonate kinase-like predicted kinase